ncbi:hypothetical protein DERP_007471 [Dermatophagoides pteronyssinus]|uniref:Uncharacterized protein n=1 Tax=Dermatophagoides pteronyssinus TaxID=6956 RepID=A0ABQ8J4G0_DERPT|nr:hypothetical protein DERP_007471 [Dermatophagoides pteronyssinus]
MKKNLKEILLLVTSSNFVDSRRKRCVIRSIVTFISPTDDFPFDKSKFGEPLPLSSPPRINAPLTFGEIIESKPKLLFGDDFFRSFSPPIPPSGECKRLRFGGGGGGIRLCIDNDGIGGDILRIELPRLPIYSGVIERRERNEDDDDETRS